MLCKTALVLTQQLYAKLQRGAEDTFTYQKLFRRLARAAFNCPGFTQAQKDDFAFSCNIDPIAAGLFPYAHHWYIFQAIGPKRGVEWDVLIVSRAFF